MASGRLNPRDVPPLRPDRRQLLVPGGRWRRLVVALGVLALALSTAQVARAAPPTASFTAVGSDPVTPDVPDVGEQVNFNGAASNDADGPVAKFEWDLDGDGSFETDTGTTATTSHTYSTAGTRTVGLRVTDGAGETAVETKPLRINALPVAGIQFAALNRTPGQDPRAPLVNQQQVAFTSTSTDAETAADKLKYAWVDASPPPGKLFSERQSPLPHAPYTTAGEKLVVLRVTDSDGAVDDEIARVRVNTPPIASLSYSPQTPLTGKEIQFDETARDDDPTFSDAPNIGALVKFEWDLDGNASTGPDGFEKTGERVTHTYTTPGTKLVRLRVTDGGGARTVVDSSQNPVQVADSRPRALFGFAPNFPLPNQDVTFTSSSSPSPGKRIIKEEWDFDYNQSTDGNISAGDVDATGPTASHSFPSADAKIVALKVTEEGGGFAIEFHTVTVNAPPQASFAAAPSTPLTDDTVTLSSTSADPDGPISQAWDTDNDGQFDDAAGAVASRMFTAPGSYTVRLRVTDDRGATAVAAGVVKVAQRPAQGVLSGRITLIDATMHFAGRTTSRGAKLTLVSVRAPVGTKVKLKCKGGDCPVGTKRVKMKQRTLRFKKLQRNLAAGTKIIIEARLDGFIGKRVEYKIRKGKAPKRKDVCIQPGASRPSACTGP
jgi:PKD repeat protein